MISRNAPSLQALPAHRAFAHRSPTRWQTRLLLAALLSALLLVAGATSGGLPRAQAVPGITTAEPNAFEKANLEAAALQAFQRVLAMWREEVYFELYANGTQESRDRMVQENFAQRMVELAWVPDGVPNPKYITPDFRHRTMIFIKARVPYRHKFNPDKRFSKDQSFLMQMENGSWRVDLVQLVRSPFH